MGLIFGGLVAAGVALHKLAHRQILRGLGMLAVCAGCIALAFFLGKSSLHTYRLHTWQMWDGPGGWHPTLALFPASPLDSTKDLPSDRMALMLGGVLVKTVASKRYTLSMADEPFLDLDQSDSGLVVSCVVLPESTVYVPIIGNKFTRSIPAGVHLTRPDSHTIRLEQKDKSIFRIEYVSPRRIDVAGVFRCEKCKSSILLTPDKGIRWEGGAVPQGATIDLSPQGSGRINFETSGRISVSPASKR